MYNLPHIPTPPTVGYTSCFPRHLPPTLCWHLSVLKDFHRRPPAPSSAQVGATDQCRLLRGNSSRADCTTGGRWRPRLLKVPEGTFRGRGRSQQRQYSLKYLIRSRSVIRQYSKPHARPGRSVREKKGLVWHGDVSPDPGTVQVGQTPASGSAAARTDGRSSGSGWRGGGARSWRVCWKWRRRARGRKVRAGK